jgi:hypothetical protein
MEDDHDEADEALRAALEASARDAEDTMEDRSPLSQPPVGANSRSDSADSGSSQPSRAQPSQARRRPNGGSQRQFQDHGGPSVEPFRNFAAEGMAVPSTAAMPGAGDTGIEMLFPPPADLMFHGNFDALRRTAEEQQKYCLINIQKNDEFASHCLNRDTWKV